MRIVHLLSEKAVFYILKEYNLKSTKSMLQTASNLIQFSNKNKSKFKNPTNITIKSEFENVQESKLIE